MGGTARTSLWWGPSSRQWGSGVGFLGIAEDVFANCLEVAFVADDFVVVVALPEFVGGIEVGSLEVFDPGVGGDTFVGFHDSEEGWGTFDCGVDPEEAVHVVWHDNEDIELDCWEPLGEGPPFFVDNGVEVRMGEQGLPEVSAKGNIVSSTGSVVVA